MLSRKIINIYAVYELDKIYVKTSSTLVNYLFGAVSLTKNADVDKYKYSGYGLGLIEEELIYYLAEGLVEI